MLEVAGPYWQSNGVNADILSLGVQAGSFAPRLHTAGYALHLLPLQFSLKFARQFLALVRCGNYDVIHMHTERAKVWIGLLAWWADIPRLIRTIHNNFPYPAPERRLRIVQRHLLRAIGVQHISISQSVHETELNWLHNACKLLPNWFNHKHYRKPTEHERMAARSTFSIESGALVLVTVGNCNVIKNHPTLLKALALLEPACPWHYLHIGAESEEREERTLARELGIQDRVHFVGSLPDPRPALWAADIYAMPSLREGFSIAALEALSCGLPAVIADVPGLKELVFHFPDVVLATPQPQALADAISTIAADLPFRRTTALTRALSVGALFGVDAGVDRYMHIYMEKEE